MIYQVKVFSPQGKLKRIVSSKMLTRKSLKEALARGQLAAFPKGGMTMTLLRKWREFTNVLDGISVGRSDR